MTKAKSRLEAAEQSSRSPLSAFMHHQQTALEEAGKAVASLLPDEFRQHTGKALEEGKAGLSALLDGVVDAVECGLDKLRRPAAETAEEPSKSKVKVEVD
jgi:hypothetical protein